MELREGCARGFAPFHPSDASPVATEVALYRRPGWDFSSLDKYDDAYLRARRRPPRLALRAAQAEAPRKLMRSDNRLPDHPRPCAAKADHVYCAC